jgi:hypothetical protein
VCQAFINDDKVFAVFTTFFFTDPNCVTQENKTFLMDRGLAASDADLVSSGGRLFTLDPPLEESLHVWVGFAHKKGYLTGKKIGVYYNQADPAVGEAYGTHLVGLLKTLGYDPVVVTSNTQATVASQGDPNDPVAVQRFKTAGVQVAFLTTTGKPFYDEAKRQGWRPLFIRFGAGAKDITTASYDRSYFQSVGVSWERANEVNSGLPPAPMAEDCMKRLAEAGVARPHREWAEWDASLIHCDYVKLMLIALKAAGRNVTTDRFVAGFNTIHDFDAALYPPLTYSARRHWGADRNRTVRYDGNCGCWKVTGPFEPLYLV